MTSNGLGDSLEVEVQDTGIGISEKQLPSIFDRFYQVDNSAVRKGEGTGLGLALVKELVELMNGNIKVESTLGKGTCLLIRFPIRNTAPMTSWTRPYRPEGGSPSTKIMPSSPTSPKDAPLALVVEDNQDVIYYLRACLEGQYRIEEAQNGKIGIEKALEQVPDIIISDVMMPEVDGFELCETLKTDERTSHIPIILLTAKVTQEDKLQGLTHGADAYLTKPFEKEELLIRLNKLVKLRRQLQERYQTHGQTEEAPEDAFLQKANTIIEDHLEENDFNVQHLAHKLGVSRIQVHRKLKALTDFTPAEYIRSIRLKKAL